MRAHNIRPSSASTLAAAMIRPCAGRCNAWVTSCGRVVLVLKDVSTPDQERILVTASAPRGKVC